MIEVTVRQPRGKLKVLYEGTIRDAKAWARATFFASHMWFRESEWKSATDAEVCYHQAKAGNPDYPGVAPLSGPLVARFTGDQA